MNGMLITAATFDDLLNSAPGEHADRITRADNACDTNMTRFWSDGGIFEFSTHCGEVYSAGPWTQLVQVANWWTNVVEANPQIEDLVLKAPGGNLPWEQIRPLMGGALSTDDVMVYCDCPDFRYSGANYNVTMDRAVYPGFEEGVAPKKHTSWGLGQARICKHLYKVFQVLRG